MVTTITRFTLVMFAAFLIIGCSNRPLAKRQKPVQIVYRFDAHRWLELQGFGCEGALWFVDDKRDIRSEVASQFYRISTRPYINASERYIAVPWWGTAGMRISRDYGKTWDSAILKGREDDEAGSDMPTYENVKSLTVVNDQGFLLTKQGHIYMSSLPFDDPRLLPGGSGIDYSREFRGKVIHHRIEARRQYEGGNVSDWGLFYVDPRILPKLTYQYYANFQNLPNRIPEVKNYQGWTHMKCDLDAGF